jgi:hypothetical protein
MADEFPEFDPGMPVIRKDKYEEILRNANSVKITLRQDDDWGFPVVVPNVLRDRHLTREQIHEIYCVHQAHCIKMDAVHHPENDTCPPLQVLIERCECLFLDVDKREFDTILGDLKRAYPNLHFKWKYGALYINGAKTRIYCKNIDKVYKVMRSVGTEGACLDFVVDLISRQLGEIFVASFADNTDTLHERWSVV